MFANAADALFQALHGMLYFPASHGAGGNHESAICNGVSDILELFGTSENISCADCGTRLAKGWSIRIDNPQMREAEVAHGAGGRANVQRIAGRDQHHAEMVEFGGRWQGKYCI